jgi:hypothetical protein
MAIERHFVGASRISYRVDANGVNAVAVEEVAGNGQYPIPRRSSQRSAMA